MDPDLAVGTNSLYVSADSVGSGGLVVVRIPLSEIQAATTIHFDFTNPANRAEPMAPTCPRTPVTPSSGPGTSTPARCACCR